MEQIISATIVSGADAIHPGFGFLSENTKFAELCEKCNIIFIGPDSKVISRLGNKSEARNTMANAGVPIIPGSREAIYDAAKGKEVAREIGYPVIVKAVSYTHLRNILIFSFCIRQTYGSSNLWQNG